jgi:hypothetical protein
MINDNQRLILKVRRAIGQAQRSAGLARAQAKVEAEKANAALTLLVDDLQQEGIDVSTPDGLRFLLLVLAAKRGGDRPYKAAFSAGFEYEEGL